MDIAVQEQVIRIAVVTPRARIDAFNAPVLRGRLEELAERGVNRFVLDLAQVPFLDSAGMAVLVSLLKRARSHEGDVHLVWPQEEAARRILRLTKFDKVFVMAETIDAALKSF